MQTFLPYPSFKESAAILDGKRLNKQSVECKQILNALTGRSKGWKNHPATKMWAGHEKALCEYAIEICQECLARNFKNSLISFFKEEIQKYPNTGNPSWLGNGSFHAAHRSNLMRKAPEHYIHYFGDIPDDLPYLWPTKK